MEAALWFLCMENAESSSSVTRPRALYLTVSGVTLQKEAQSWLLLWPIGEPRNAHNPPGERGVSSTWSYFEFNRSSELKYELIQMWQTANL